MVGPPKQSPFRSTEPEFEAETLSGQWPVTLKVIVPEVEPESVSDPVADEAIAVPTPIPEIVRLIEVTVIEPAEGYWLVTVQVIT